MYPESSTPLSTSCAQTRCTDSKEPWRIGSRHLYDSDVDTVGHAINEVITVTCGHGVGRRGLLSAVTYAQQCH